MPNRLNVWQLNAQRASSDRAYNAGAKPKSVWTKKILLRVLERKYDKLTAAIADGYPFWFLEEKFLKPWSIEHSGPHGRATTFLNIDDAAVEAMMDDPYDFDDEYLEAARMRKMQSKLKARFAREWPRRYGLYRKYRDLCIEDDLFLDASITSSQLAQICERRARAALNGGEPLDGIAAE